MKSGLVKVSDGAHIYYEMEGSGCSDSWLGLFRPVL